MFELYEGSEVIVDYHGTEQQDIIDYFDEESNFEGYATLDFIDYSNGKFYIKELENKAISLNNLIAINSLTNDYQYYMGV